MVQSPSWAANWFAASQEIPHISRNPKVHYRTHNRPPPVPILGQPNPVHIPTSHLLEIQLILSIHLRLGLSSGLFPSGFSTKTLYTTPPLLNHTRHMPSPPHLTLLFISATHFPSLHFPSLFTFYRLHFPSLVFTFLTLVLKICVLSWILAIAPSGSLLY